MNRHAFGYYLALGLIMVSLGIIVDTLWPLPEPWETIRYLTCVCIPTMCVAVFGPSQARLRDLWLRHVRHRREVAEGIQVNEDGVFTCGVLLPGESLTVVVCDGDRVHAWVETPFTGRRSEGVWPASMFTPPRH